MSDLPQQDTIIQYQADGVETDYVFDFYVPQDTDIDVYVTLAGESPIPADDIKILTTDYTVTFNADPTTGGTITFVLAETPPNEATVTLSRNVKASLDVEFSNATTFNGQNLDDALDRLLLLIQQNKTLINSDQQRVLSYRVNAFESDSNILANTQIPVLEENQIWMGSGDGVTAVTLEENPDVSTLRSQLENNDPATDGARLVGYYDEGSLTATTVSAFLNSLNLSTTIFKPGMMIDFAGSTAPDGWLLCDGDNVSRETYANLFAAIGTTWGVGDGSTTFTLPDFRRRVSVGSGGTGSATLGNAVGDTGGAETHTLTIDEMPEHDHPGSTIDVNTTLAPGAGANDYPRSPGTGTDPVIVAPQGGDQPHNIMQPSAIVQKLIKI